MTATDDGNDRWSMIAAVVLVAGCAAFAGCAMAPASAPTASAAPAASEAPPTSMALAGSRAGATIPLPPDAAGLKPFDEVVKDARRADGFFTLWQKDDKVWLEIRPDQLGVPLLFSAQLASGLGEAPFLPGLFDLAQVVVLRRIGTQVQLIARNLDVRAVAGTPLAGAVRESFSDSLLAAAPLAAQPRIEGKAFLVDAAVLFGADIVGLQTELESAFRLPYAFDSRNSSLARVRSTSTATTLTLRAHYALARLPAPPPTPGPLAPRPPASLPDPRSLFIDLAYVLQPLPAVPMNPRRADQRVGHFTTTFWDLGGDAQDPGPRQDGGTGGGTDGGADGGEARSHLISRWRLDKLQPEAAVSDPRQPIVVWLDRNIPERWRAVVSNAVLEWNQAFERAGLSHALQVRQQPADADWSTLDGARHIAVRWFAFDGPGALAVARQLTDPRTGEILQATVIISENWVRFNRTAASEYLPLAPSPAPPWQSSWQSSWQPFAESSAQRCDYGAAAAAQNAFALDLLAARGAVAPDSTAAEQFVRDALRAVVLHEVGHALGLRHNLRASASVPRQRLRDLAYVRAHGVSNSVMDYNALNIPLDGEPPTEYHQLVLGAYDYWAIEYAYRLFGAGDESGALAQLAARSALDPALAYGTDEDAGSAAIDPLINRYDLGDDPLAFYERSFALARELWHRTERLELAPGQSYALYRRNLLRGLRYIGEIAPLITKYVGGMQTTRDLAGAGRPLLLPVAAVKQREALDLLAGDLFSIDSFRFDPAFLGRLGVDYLEREAPRRGAAVQGSDAPGTVDFNLAAAVLAIQRGVLDLLMSDATAARLVDAENLVGDPSQRFTLAQMHQRLAAAIWGELDGADRVSSLRRDLQRDHLRRIAAALLQPASPVAADTAAVQREVAARLAAQLRRALRNPRLDGTTRAHLALSLETVDRALEAPLARQAP